MGDIMIIYLPKNEWCKQQSLLDTKQKEDKFGPTETRSCSGQGP